MVLAWFSFWFASRDSGQNKTHRRRPTVSLRNPVCSTMESTPTASTILRGYRAQPCGALRHPVHLGGMMIHSFRNAGTLAHRVFESSNYFYRALARAQLDTTSTDSSLAPQRSVGRGAFHPYFQCVLMQHLLSPTLSSTPVEERESVAVAPLAPVKMFYGRFLE